jgi:hypothetical protein
MGALSLAIPSINLRSLGDELERWHEVHQMWTGWITSRYRDVSQSSMSDSPPFLDAGYALPWNPTAGWSLQD